MCLPNNSGGCYDERAEYRVIRESAYRTPGGDCPICKKNQGAGVASLASAEQGSASVETEDRVLFLAGLFR